MGSVVRRLVVLEGVSNLGQRTSEVTAEVMVLGIGEQRRYGR